MSKVIERACELICLIRKKPRTVAEIVDLWEGRGGSCTTVTIYVKALHEEGLIFIGDYVRKPGQRGNPSALYVWQPEPFMFPDYKLGEVFAMKKSPGSPAADALRSKMADLEFDRVRVSA